MRVRFNSGQLERHAKDLCLLSGADPNSLATARAQDDVQSMTIPTPDVATERWEAFVPQAIASLTDEQLVDLWEQVPDPENLSAHIQGVINEMERRSIDF